MEVYLSSDAASEAALRDNAALRQKSLLPVVIHVYSPKYVICLKMVVFLVLILCLNC